MSELWEPGAVTIDGPDGLRVELSVSLRSETRREIAKIQQHVTLPLLDTDWVGVAKKVRGDDRFTRHFDQAESLELSVSRAGVGYASLIADRGFQPEFGARPLRRTIQRELDNRLSRLLLAADLAPGQTVHVDAADDRLTFTVSSAPAPANA